MDTTTVVTTEISVDRILALTAEKQTLENTIASLNREIGSKETLIEKLEDELEKIEKKQPEVRIITQERKKDSWGWTDQTTSTEYKNLSLVQDDIRKEMDIKYNDEITSLKQSIKQLEKELIETIDAHTLVTNKAKFENTKTIQTINLGCEEDRLNFEKIVTMKNRDIKELEEKIVKIQNDKTEEQLTKAREKEIVDLQVHIGELENIIKEMQSTNIFKHIWNSILNGKARVIAQKQLLEKKELISVIKSWRW